MAFHCHCLCPAADGMAGQAHKAKPQSCTDFQHGPNEKSGRCCMVLINVINSALSQPKRHQVDHFRSRNDFTAVKLISKDMKCREKAFYLHNISDFFTKSFVIFVEWVFSLELNVWAENPPHFHEFFGSRSREQGWVKEHDQLQQNH